MPVAVSNRGLKRICPSCGTRYYDFNKRPVLCPECKTEFTGEMKVKARRGRASVVEDDEAVLGDEGLEAKDVNLNEDDEDALEEAEDTVSLDDVEEDGDESDDEEDAMDIDDLDDDFDDDDDLDDDDDDDDEDDEEDED